ncbi:MAG: N-6 DNA methylase [Magnetococcales bacterium]|nr:N-6 DNA methylase [Magnetococcales bacterium]
MTSVRYSASAGLAHRKRWGQYFTAPAIADFMCRWILQGGARAMFDPAFGLGAFHQATRAIDPAIPFSGTELDENILAFYQQNGDGSPPLIHWTDYLLHWSEIRRPGIVCNPPYLRFQRFVNRKEVLAAFQRQLGVKLPGYTNIASAFLLKSLSELEEGGRLAYLMPLEFLNTGYGETIKQALLENGLLKAIIRLDCEKEAFPDAITTLGILLAARDGRRDPVAFHTASRLEDLKKILNHPAKALVPPEGLLPSEKWLNRFETTRHDFSFPDLRHLNYYGTFSRGIATGANAFFIVNQRRAEAMGLSPTHLLPCISRSAQVTGGVLDEAALQGLLARQERLLLVNLVAPLDETATAYVAWGEAEGFHQRYLTRNRNPWHRLEKRTPAPLWFGVFSRNAFKVVRNRARALHLTCFHGFHPHHEMEPWIDYLFLYFNSRAARTILGRNKRRYGDGLEKFEPNDLNLALAPTPRWFSRLPEELVRHALSAPDDALPPELEARFDQLLLADPPP